MEGNFVQDKACGHFKLYDGFGRMYYQGYMEDNKYDLNGHLTNFDTMERYEGRFWDGKKDDKGSVYHIQDGQDRLKYKGEF
jgi:hypothetical protein